MQTTCKPADVCFVVLAVIVKAVKPKLISTATWLAHSKTQSYRLKLQYIMHDTD